MVAVQIRNQSLNALPVLRICPWVVLEPSWHEIFLGLPIVDDQPSLGTSLASRCKVNFRPCQISRRISVGKPKASRAGLMFTGEQVEIEQLGLFVLEAA